MKLELNSIFFPPVRRELRPSNAALNISIRKAMNCVFAVSILVLPLASALGITANAAEPAAATSAMTDPYAVDWGARFDQARAAKDANALIQILDKAPIPEWNDILDKAAQELAKQCDVPNIDKPESRGSFLYLPAVPVEGATDKRVKITHNATLNTGTMILSPIPGSLPRETAGVSISLKPPVTGVSVEIFELTLVKGDGGERITTSVLIGIGPSANAGTLELTGAITAKNRGNATLAEIPIDLKLEIERAAPLFDKIGMWYRNALAQRFMAATVKTGEKRTDWLQTLFGGDNTEVDKKNRGPNARKYDLLAFCYGEFLRQVARSPQTVNASDANKQIIIELADGEATNTELGSDNANESGETTDENSDAIPNLELTEDDLVRFEPLQPLPIQPATVDPSVIRAATDCLMFLERFELRRAQYMASREGRPIPESVEPGYWWKPTDSAGYSEDVATNVNRPPRYAN